MTTLVFEDLDTGETHAVVVKRVLVAGFTGRDQDEVARHIAELAELGVPVPSETPTLYRLGADAVRQTAVLTVDGPNTSGEVEPVIVVAGGRRFLTVGSDHTDRDVEKVDIAASKAACLKVVATSFVALEGVEWDSLEVAGQADGEPYQSGGVRSLLPLETILAHLQEEGVELGDGDVVFLGTVPVVGGIRPSSLFGAELRLADGRVLDLAYRITDVSGTTNRRLDKPEIEFTSVDRFEWTPVEGVPGQTERVLARDPQSGLATRMLRFEPGTDTSELGVLRHDFWEEVYILSGELHDLTLDVVFPADTYACRPPGMPHGPWRSETGCITFEVRYPPL